MPLDDLLNLPCTITHAAPGGDEDEYGNPTDGTSSTETVCELQQRQRSETDDDAISDTRWLLILPAGTAIDSGDTVTAVGETFQVEGAPWEARNPRTQAASHIEVTLRQTSATGGS